MDSHHYVGVGLVPAAYSPHPQSFLDHNSRFNALAHAANQPMAWQQYASNPAGTASSSSSLYSAMAHSAASAPADHLVHSPSIHSRHTNSYATQSVSPSLDPGPSVPFDPQQIDGHTGPIRVTRRRAREAALAQLGHGAGPSTVSNPVLDRRVHSLAFGHSSRPQTPTNMHGTSYSYSDAIGHLGTSQSPEVVGPPYFLPAHSRSTSDSTSSSHPRSTSPALSVSSALTSVSSVSGAKPRSFSSMPPPQEPSLDCPPPKHRKQRLFSTDRKKICVYHRDHPDAKQEEIANVFGVERSTVSKILKDKDRWLNVKDDEPMQVAKWRPSKFPNIERELVKWLEECSKTKVMLTDTLIRSKAREVALEQGIGEDRFKASSGWVENFKNRHGISKGEWHRQEGMPAQQRSLELGGEFVPTATTNDDDPRVRAHADLEGSPRHPDPLSAHHGDHVDNGMGLSDGDGQSPHDHDGVQYAPPLAPAWDAPSSSSAVYEHPVSQSSALGPGHDNLSMPAAMAGGHAHGHDLLVEPSSQLQYPEPEQTPADQMPADLKTAEMMLRQLLSFFKRHQGLITYEQEEQLRQIYAAAYDRSQGIVR